jgi:hypothetical protein
MLVGQNLLFPPLSNNLSVEAWLKLFPSISIRKPILLHELPLVSKFHTLKMLIAVENEDTGRRECTICGYKHPCKQALQARQQSKL